MFDPSSTIVALATPPGRGGIGVIRISGSDAQAIAARMLVSAAAATVGRPRRGRQGRAEPGAWRGSATEPVPDPRSPPFGEAQGGLREHKGVERPVPALSPRHATRCFVLGPAGSAVDEVVATLFAGPYSYTGEDVVEISAHGSPELLREILQSAMRAGARLAEPGEFTLRAFLNGRLDLAQAEAVNDLVEAVTPLQARVAFDQLQGTLTDAIGRLDRELFDLCVRLEASLDFPDEGYHFADRADLVAEVKQVRDGVAALLATARHGRVVREGRQIAILGKPNVGKSTLFNRLVGSDRAIVTDIPGTTRDLLTETVDFEGIRLGVVDTAGIRAGADIIEAEGVARARRAAEVADVIVLVFDQSRPLEHWDIELQAETRDKPQVLVINKTDLEPCWHVSELIWDSPQSPRERVPLFGSPQAGEPQTSVLSGPRVPGPGSRVPTALAPVPVSLRTGEGWPAFHEALLRALDAGEPLRDTPLVTNVRHQALLEQALAALEKVTLSFSVETGEKESVTFSTSPSTIPSEEFLLADLAVARQAFEEITGKRTSEDVLQAIFSRFCIGK